jgi:protein-tyrosine phosphatase
MKGIFWIKGIPVAPLAILIRPRGDDLLEDALLRIKESGIQTLVSMMENWEADSLGLADEGQLAKEIGLKFLTFPIPDTRIPIDAAAFRSFVIDLASRLREGEHIGIHCRGSIGRSTVAAACALMHLGWRADKALDAIEDARGCAVPDTQEQEEFILHYKVQPGATSAQADSRES